MESRYSLLLFQKQHNLNSAAYKYFSRDSLDPTLRYHMFRRQFPVKLAFAFTINKAQGQSFEWNGIYLPDHVFSHGQLYVVSGSEAWGGELLRGAVVLRGGRRPKPQ